MSWESDGGKVKGVNVWGWGEGEWWEGVVEKKEVKRTSSSKSARNAHENRRWRNDLISLPSRDWWGGQWEGPGNLHIKAAVYELLRKHETHSFLRPLCLFSLLSFHLHLHHLPLSLSPPQLLSSSLSPSCRHGTGRLPSRPLTCGRTCSPLGHRAPKASETPLWKVRDWSVAGGMDIFGVKLIDSLTRLSSFIRLLCLSLAVQIPPCVG